MSPRVEVIAVIKTGRWRDTAPGNTASAVDKPSATRWLMDSDHDHPV